MGPIATLGVGVIIPETINYGAGWPVVRTTIGDRVRFADYASAVAGRLEGAADVRLDLTFVVPDVLDLPFGANGQPVDRTLAARGLERVLPGDLFGRVVLVPGTKPHGNMVGGAWGGASDDAGSAIVRDIHNQCGTGQFGSVGCTLLHELLHWVEWRLDALGVAVGYGHDVPAVHDGTLSTGGHRPNYVPGRTDRDEWVWLRDWATGRVPRPLAGSTTYGMTAARWREVASGPAVGAWPPPVESGNPPRRTADPARPPRIR